jgi:hypothetical protein
MIFLGDSLTVLPNRCLLFRTPRPIHSVVGLNGLPFLSTHFALPTVLQSKSSRKKKQSKSSREKKKLFYEFVRRILYKDVSGGFR